MRKTGLVEVPGDHPDVQSSEPLVTATEARSPRPALAIAVLLALSAVLFAIRVLGPPNLLDQDQERPASYVLDAVKNGNWICQKDWTGDITSKPPLWTWLAALATLAAGRIGVFPLYLPGALAATGTALLIYHFGRARFGARAAFLGAIAALITTAAAKQFGLARTDGVFTFTVTLTALLGYRAWTSGRGWTSFWMAAAVATLTKGPVGLLLGAFGLLAAFWERRAQVTAASAEPRDVRSPSGGTSVGPLVRHVPGVLLYIAVTGGWFALAYGQLGEALIAKMIGKELVGHAVTSSNRNLPGLLIWQPPLYYLSRALPWSLLAYYGLWRSWRQPARGHEERRFERFLFCWFAAGLLLFSLAPHQRADLLWPLMPAGALIAGRELDRWTRRYSARRFYAAFALCIGLGLLGLGWYYFVSQARQSVVRQTIALKKLAGTIERQAGRAFPITYVDAPMTLQIYLDMLRSPVTFERAAEILRSAEPAFVAVTDARALETRRQAGDPAWHHVLQTPGYVRKRAVIVVSNRAELAPTDGFALASGPWTLTAYRARCLSAGEDEMALEPLGETASVEILNHSPEARTYQVRWAKGQQMRIQNLHVAAGAAATLRWAE